MNNVRNFGAVGDGITKDTAAIQRAIDAGGVVHFPPGTYLSGTLYLKSGGGLDLAPGAILLASPDKADYNTDDFIPQNRFSVKEKVSGAHFIVGVKLTDVVLRGGGIIDGNRKAFMDTPMESNPERFQLQEWRPGQMIYFVECEHLNIQNLRLNNPPYWSCFLHGCRFVTVTGLHIENDSRTHNADGIDIDCCAYVTVSDCIIHTADDCITLRGNEDPLGRSVPCEYVTVTNCILSTRCNAFRVGVGNGLIRRCVISNCVIHDTRTGICLVSQYSPVTRGVTIEDIQFHNLRMDCARPFNIATTPGGIRPEEAGIIRRISFSHIRGTAVRSSIIQGSRKGYVQEISFRNMEFEFSPAVNVRVAPGTQWYGEFLAGDPPSAFFIQNSDQICFDDVKLRFCENDIERSYAVWSVNSDVKYSPDCVWTKKNHD